MSGIGKWFAISNDGAMSSKDMLKELPEFKACPIMCYEESGKNIVPIFPRQSLAVDFANRNTPKSFTIGTMEVFQSNIDQLESNGYKVIEINWPKKRTTSIVILYIEDIDVDTKTCGYRREIK